MHINAALVAPARLSLFNSIQSKLWLDIYFFVGFSKQPHNTTSNKTLHNCSQRCAPSTDISPYHVRKTCIEQREVALSDSLPDLRSARKRYSTFNVVWPSPSAHHRLPRR